MARRVGARMFRSDQLVNLWAEATGTYTLGSNCTGTAVVITPNHFGPLNLAFVVVKQGREVRTVLDTNAIVGVFNKIE